MERRSHGREIKGLTRPAWLLLMALMQLLLLASFLLAGNQEPSRLSSPEGSPTETIEQHWGVRVLGIHLSAAGYMLDFRYRVLDTVKASPLFDLSIKPVLIDQATNARMMVPAPDKVGPLRSSAKSLFPDRNYFIMFANPGKYIQRGSKVTVEIGAFRVTDLVVQ